MSMKMNEKTHNRVWKWSLIGLFGMAALAMAASGYWLKHHQTQAIRNEKQNELKAIAELKASQIVAWRNERLADARVHSRRVFLRAAVGRWLNAAGDALSRREVAESMESLRTSYGYENVIVAARDGKILFTLNPRLTVLDASAKQLVAEAMLFTRRRLWRSLPLPKLQPGAFGRGSRDSRRGQATGGRAHSAV